MRHHSYCSAIQRRRTSVTQTGFSLVQLLVCVALLGVCSLVSIPALAKKSLVESETKKLVRAIESVSMRALYRGDTLSIYLTREELYAVSRTNPKKRIITRILHPKTKLLSERKELTFHAQGIASPASFIVTDGGDRCVIIVALRGRVSYTCPPL